MVGINPRASNRAMVQQSKPPVDAARSEPEIIPPGRADGHSARDAHAYFDVHGAHRIYVASLGPLRIILAMLVIEAIVVGMVFGGLDKAVDSYREACVKAGQKPGRAMCSYFIYIADDAKQEDYGRERQMDYFNHCVLQAFPQKKEDAPPTMQYFLKIVDILKNMKKEDLSDKSILLGSPQKIIETLSRNLLSLDASILSSPASPLQVMGGTFGPLFEFMGSAGIVMVLVVFFLVRRDDLRDRFIRLVGHGRHDPVGPWLRRRPGHLRDRHGGVGDGERVHRLLRCDRRRWDRLVRVQFRRYDECSNKY
jgi:hypothetical protein